MPQVGTVGCPDLPGYLDLPSTQGHVTALDTGMNRQLWIRNAAGKSSVPTSTSHTGAKGETFRFCWEHVGISVLGWMCWVFIYCPPRS